MSRVDFGVARSPFERFYEGTWFNHGSAGFQVEPRKVPVAIMTAPPLHGLRALILRGGVLLSIRQALGMVFGVVGVLITTRILGPTYYGTYAAAFGIHQYAMVLGQAGIGVYLVRGMKDVDEEDFNVASTFLLLIGCAGALVEAFVLPAFGSLIGLGAAMPILTLLACSLPVQLVTTAATARVERRLDFGRVAFIEVSSQILYYLVAIPLALAGWNSWSLAIAWIVQQIVQCAQYHLASRWIPRPAWNGTILSRMLRYAVGYSTSTWIWQARSLVNPLIVGSLLGVEAVGFVSLAIKITEVLSFVKSTTWRLSLAALGRLQGDKHKMLTAISEGMELQVLGVGPLYVLFACVGDQLIAYFFGLRWLPAYHVFPFIAVAYLTNCVFSLQFGALYVYRKNIDVVIFSSIHIFLFSGSAYFFVRSFGLIGYGYAELAALVAYVVSDLSLRRHVGIPSYAAAAPWYIPFAFALLLRPVGLWISVCLFLTAVAWPANWRRIMYYGRALRGIV